MSRGDPREDPEIRGPSVAPARRFSLIPFADIQFSHGTKWLVRGLLAATGLATIFGAPKQYKSFVALDVALAIAGGRKWAGRSVRQGAVVYIVAEGATGFADRVAGNRARFGLPEDLPFFLVKGRPNLGVVGGEVGDLIAAIRPVIEGTGQELAAIFIDTLVRTLAGASENDEGMRNFTDNCELLAEYFGCLAVAVHHTGKDQTRGMRGSSALHGAVVSSWRVEKTESMLARVTLEDAKDGSSGFTWTAQLERYVYGRDEEDGAEESVLVVADVSEPVAESAAADASPAGKTRGPSLPPQLRLFMACLDIAVGEVGFMARPFHDGPMIKVVTEEALKAAYFARRGDEANDEAKRKSFKNALRSGVERQVIVVEVYDGKPVVWRKDR